MDYSKNFCDTPIKPPKKNTPWTEDKIKTMFNMREDGHTWASIAEEIGIHASCVCTKYKRLTGQDGYNSNRPLTPVENKRKEYMRKLYPA